MQRISLFSTGSIQHCIYNTVDVTQYLCLIYIISISVFIPDHAIAPLVLIYYVWHIESATYGPCWRTISRMSKFLDFIIISVLHCCSIIYSTNDPHRCPLFVLHNTIQRGTGLLTWLMISIKHGGKALAKFIVELFGVKMTPWFLKMTPCFKVNVATGPPLKFSGMNTGISWNFAEW
jgi:hypothetical protein